MITPELIERRIENFWGYGSLDAPVWFVGMEDGLGPLSGQQLQQELYERFRVADGRKTVDMRSDMASIAGHMKFYSGSNAKLQRTFIYPIGLYLYLKLRRQPEAREIRHHQGAEFGDVSKKMTTAIDIMPLPSRAASEEHWLYGSYPVPGLRTRREYLDTYLDKRAARLRTLVETHEPKLVIFYSTGAQYRAAWDRVINAPTTALTKGMYFAREGNTLFCMLPHGVSHGMSYDRVYEFGEKLIAKAPIKL